MGDNVGEYSVPVVSTTNSQKIPSQASVEVKPSRKLGYKIGGILIFLIFLGLFIWLSYILGFGEGEGLGDCTE
jgi:hypothetical protein